MKLDFDHFSKHYPKAIYKQHNMLMVFLCSLSSHNNIKALNEVKTLWIKFQLSYNY